MMNERLLRIAKAELKRRTGQEVPDAEIEKVYESLIEQGKICSRRGGESARDG